MYPQPTPSHLNIIIRLCSSLSQDFCPGEIQRQLEVSLIFSFWGILERKVELVRWVEVFPKTWWWRKSRSPRRLWQQPRKWPDLQGTWDGEWLLVNLGCITGLRSSKCPQLPYFWGITPAGLCNLRGPGKGWDSWWKRWHMEGG